MEALVDHIHNVSSQVLAVLTGEEPAINRVAIISAENPHEEPLSPEINQMRNDKLVQMLQESSYTTFWTVEEILLKPIGNSLLVPNISKEQALKFGGLFDQETIIFGFKAEGGEMVYELLCASDFSGEHPIGQTIGNKCRIELLDDGSYFFFETDGLKFSFQFFNYAFDKKYTDFYSHIKRPISPEDDVKLDRLIKESLDSKKTAKYRFLRRGLIKEVYSRYY